MTDLLGEGAISTVVRCSHPSVTGDVAVKMYHRDRVSEPQYKQVLCIPVPKQHSPVSIHGFDSWPSE